MTLNALARAHAVTRHLFSALGIRELPVDVHRMKNRETEPYTTIQVSRHNRGCPECQRRLCAGRFLPPPVRDP